MPTGSKRGGGVAAAVAQRGLTSAKALVAALLAFGAIASPVMAVGAESKAVAASAAATDGGGVKQLRRGTAHDALYDIAFDGQRGIAVGALGAVLTTSDGGASWESQPSPVHNLALLSVAIKGDKCIAVGQTGIVFTADDCKTWKASPSVTKSRLLAVGVNAQGLAYAVGGFGTILRSTDWGKTWVPQVVDWKGFTEGGAEPHLYDVHVAEDGTPTIVGEFELILRATNGGSQWKALHKGERSLFGLTVLGDGRAFAVGQSGGVLASSDGGATWRSLSSGSGAILTGVYATPTGQLLVSGSNTALLSKDDGVSWTRVSSKFIANGWLQALAAGAGAGGKPRLLGVGSGGSILEIDL